MAALLEPSLLAELRAPTLLTLSEKGSPYHRQRVKSRFVTCKAGISRLFWRYMRTIVDGAGWGSRILVLSYNGNRGQTMKRTMPFLRTSKKEISPPRHKGTKNYLCLSVLVVDLFSRCALRSWRFILLGAVSLAMLSGAVANAAETATFSLRKVQLRDWMIQGEIQKVVGMKLYDLIDGFADIHLGFNYIDSEHTKLKKGKQELEISVFRVDSPDNAYGLYSCLRQRDGELLNLLDEASYSSGTVILWRGPYCAEVKDVSEEGASKEEMVAVTKAIGEALEGKHQPPELVRALPPEKLLYQGMLYFHNRHPLDQIWYMGTENVLLLGADVTSPTKVEAVYATYDLSNGAQGVLTIRYPKADEAQKALNLYTESVRKDMVSVNDQPAWRTLTAKNGKQTLAFQKDRLLILGLESSEPDALKPILEKTAKNLEPRKVIERKQ